MGSKKHSVSLLFFLSIFFSVEAHDTLLVSLSDKTPFNKFQLIVEAGSYSINTEHATRTVEAKDTIDCEVEDTLVHLTFNNDILFANGGFEFMAQETNSKFRLLHESNGFSKQYYDHFRFYFLDEVNFKLVNKVSLEHYVSAVVEAEAGYGKPYEFYKLQSIISRTYALNNKTKHTLEGFDLCDNTHCQAYKGTLTEYSPIIKATKETNFIILVDESIDYVNTTFHANCGGETVNSEDVWVSRLDYLRGGEDNHCKPFQWQKKISVAVWKDYLKRNGVTNFDSVDFTFSQPSRIVVYKPGIFDLKLIKIRKDWGLKSTFFTIEQEGDNMLLLKGKGFGHGVGLCQHGAIAMARKKYTYQEIIHQYYQNVYLVDLRALSFYRW